MIQLMNEREKIKMEIKELQTKKEILSAFPVMNQLRTHLDVTTYQNLVMDAKENDHYHLFALYDGGNIAAVTGFKPMITLYNGRFVWVCDLVTDRAQRSKGYGAKLLNFVQDWAIKNGYSSVALSSGLQRKDAHRFYTDKMNYDKVSFVFKRSLNK